jgi:hypothetical protein
MKYSLLTELLQSSYEFELVEKANSYYQADFVTNNGDKVKVTFDWWSSPELYEIAFYRSGKIDMTGGGDAIKIFATIVKILQEFIKETNPPFIAFSSKKSETSRTSFYNRLVSKFAAASGYIKVEDISKINHSIAPGWIKNAIKLNVGTEFMVLAQKKNIK